MLDVNGYICTTPWQVTEEGVARARAVANWFSCAYIERRNRSIAQLRLDTARAAVIVADVRPRVYHTGCPDQPLFFHPSTACQRILRMARGESDRLMRLAGIRAGDVVVDATFGLGSDSLVFASAVGAQGAVQAFEHSVILARLFTYSKQYPVQLEEPLQALLGRIALQQGDYVTWLSQQPENMVDVVYFDPMFEGAESAAGALDPLRPFADTRTLTTEAFADAQRVARRCVVVKARPDSEILRRLALRPDKLRAHVAYGVWHKGITDSC